MPQGGININGRARQANTYDAIVVGSGISGGFAAMELCRKGLKTLVLERGRQVEHVKDYPSTSLHPWEFSHRGRVTEEDRRHSPVQSKVYAYDEGSRDFFVKDVDHPYQQLERFDWIRGYHVGGRSLLWGRQCYRWSDLDFEANLKDGHGVDWPIRYRDLAPWYDYVERFVGISGSRENLAQLPDGQFLPPMEMNCLEKHIASSIDSQYTDRRMIIGRVANLTRGYNGRGPCQYRNLCHRGCPFGGYFSSNSATLPAAMATGLMTLRPDSVVMEVLYDRERKRSEGVRVLDARTGRTEEFFAKVIFLCASTLGTTHILLNSVSDAFPKGLGNGSDQVGRNLMDHHYQVGAGGSYEGLKDRYTYGRRPNGIYVPRFRNVNAQTKMKDFVRGYGYQGGANRGRPERYEGIGEGLKEALSEPGAWSMWLGGWGEHLPYSDNTVTLNRDKKDIHGLPTLDIRCTFRDNEKAMRRDMMNSAAEMLEKAGLKDIYTFDNDAAPGFCIHEMGTARMGRDARTSVLNRWNQMHEVKNVFITDGACMTSSACQNPSITYMALTARAVDYAAGELKKKNL